MGYENLLIEAEQHGIYIIEKRFKSKAKGLIKGNRIGINKSISKSAEKKCVAAEELGHYYTSVGNILDQSSISNRKQELKARTWAFKKLFPLFKIVQAHQAGVRNRYELAEYLDITEEFLGEALQRYKAEYGLHKKIGQYTICFDPLGVVELFEDA